MPRVRAQKSSFSAGEISPDLLGRGDLRAYENGVLKLRNTFIHPTGGVTRRHGLRFVDIAPGSAASSLSSSTPSKSICWSSPIRE
jgi:hypothetical protein